MKSRNRVTNDDTRDERESEGNEIENDFSLFPFLHPFFPTIEEHLESNGWKIPFEPRNSGNENRGGEKKKKKRREKKNHESRGQRNVSHCSPFFPFFFFLFPPFFFPQLEKARYVTTRGIRARVYFTFHQCASNARVTRLERGNGACTRVHGRVAGL